MSTRPKFLSTSRLICLHASRTYARLGHHGDAAAGKRYWARGVYLASARRLPLKLFRAAGVLRVQRLVVVSLLILG